jgi:hypothetical protein
MFDPEGPIAPGAGAVHHFLIPNQCDLCIYDGLSIAIHHKALDLCNADRLWHIQLRFQ